LIDDTDLINRSFYYQQEKHDATFLKKDYRVEKILSVPHRKKAVYGEILKDWPKHLNLSQLNAKYKYFQLCRTLKTYGTL